ncbi:MAG: LysM peptidoglycan-binding domain-containing protein [Parachlamydiaceae bacterium]
MSDFRLNQIKRLSGFLFISLSLNAILGVSLGYYFWVDRPPTPVCEHLPSLVNKTHPPETLPLEAKVTLQALKKLSTSDLKAKLNDTRVVEMGYTVRDLSVAALSDFYLVDIEKAVKRPLEEKWLTYGSKGETIVVYAGLSDEDYKSITTYLEQEKWPFKAQGLFKLLKSEKWRDDVSLQNAFFLTPEFLTIEALFNRSLNSRADLLDLILSSDYGKLKAYHERHKSLHDLSDGERRLFLIDYLSSGSFVAANLLLKNDFEFTLKKLDDNQAITLLTLLKEKTPEAEKYAKEIVLSPRSDRVRRVAIERLYEYAGKPLPEKFDLADALKTYLPAPVKTNLTPIKPLASTKLIAETAPQKVKPITPVKTPAKIALKTPLKKEKIYIVQGSDTLSKVAKQFKIEASVIKKMNGLESDQIKPGMALRIPIPAQAPDRPLPSTKERSVKDAKKSAPIL